MSTDSLRLGSTTKKNRENILKGDGCSCVPSVASERSSSGVIGDGVRSRFLSDSGVLPRMMSLVAEQRVMRSGIVQERALKHNAMTSARKLEERKTSVEGFF